MNKKGSTAFEDFVNQNQPQFHQRNQINNNQIGLLNLQNIAFFNTQRTFINNTENNSNSSTPKYESTVQSNTLTRANTYQSTVSSTSKTRQNSDSKGKISPENYVNFLQQNSILIQKRKKIKKKSQKYCIE